MYRRFIALAGVLSIVAALLAVSGCASAPPTPVPTPTAAPKTTAPPKEAHAPTATKAAPAPTATAAAKPASPAPEPKAAALAKVDFGMIPAVMASPNYVALEKGYLREQGIDLTVEGFPDTVRIMTLIATNKLNLGQVTMGVAAFNAFARKADMVIVASGNQEASTFLMVRKDLYDSGAVKSVADLKGRKVALNGKGTVLEYSMAKMLEKAGLKMTDVDIPLIPWPEMVVAMQNKAIDAGLIAEPTATMAVNMGAGVKIMSAFVPRGQYGTILANSVWAKDNPQVVSNYLVGYLKALRDMNEGKIHQDAAALDIIFKYTKVPVETLKAIPGPYWDPNGRLDKKSIQDVQQFFLESKAVTYPEPLSINSMVDESYLEKALAIVGTVPK